MTLKKKKHQIKNKFFKNLLTHKQVRRITLTAFFIHFTFFLGAYLIAILYSNYSITRNLISSLSSYIYTPFPFLIDIAFISIGVLLIPFFIYLDRYLMPQLDNISRSKIKIAEGGCIFGVIGAVGFIGIGIFSIDLDVFFHDYFAELFFIGFIFNALLIGIFIVVYDTNIPRILGIYGIFSPLFTYLIYLIFTIAIIEWILYTIILIWLLSLTRVVLY
jgi:hypothetical membrane protein